MAQGLSELLCRACLKDDELMVDIYEHVEEQKTDLCTLLERCGGIKIAKSDIYSKLLCQECTEELLIAAKFRAKCEATEQSLIKWSNNCLIHKEVVVEQDGEVLVSEEVEDIEPDSVQAHFVEYNPSEDVDSYEECETLTEIETDLGPKTDIESLIETIDEEPEPQPLAKAVGGIIYNCDDCGAVFQHTSTLQRHIAKAHAPVTTYECSLCGHRFTKDTNLEKHSCSGSIVDVPTIQLPRHRCKYCGKYLQSASSLTMHLRLHTGEQPFVCDVCSKAFKTNSGLVTHQKRHLKLMEYECKFCGKGFVESSNLRRHVAALHTADRPHTCTICNRSFTRVYLLQLHKRTHTGERPYACSICERTFAQLSSMRSHELIHTGERRHRCSHCQKTFTRVKQLRTHELKSCVLLKSQASTNVDEGAS